MKTEFSYPSQREELAAFKAAYPEHVVIRSGSKMIVLTGSDIPPAQVQKCDDLQFHLALAAMGIADQVKTYVASQDAFAQSWFSLSKTFRSDNPMLLQHAAAMGLSDQIPQLFAVAKTMPKN